MPSKDSKKPEVPKRSYTRKPKHDPLPPSLLAKAAEAAANRVAARTATGKRRPALQYSTSTVDVVDNREAPKAPVHKNAMKHDDHGISAGQPKKFKILDFVPSRYCTDASSIAKSTPPVLVEVLSFQRIETISEVESLFAETTDSDQKVKQMADFLEDMKATFGLLESAIDDFDPQPGMASSTPIKASREGDSVKTNPANSGTRKELYADEKKKSKRVKGEKVDWSKVPVQELSLYATDSEDEAETLGKENVHQKAFTDPVKSSEHFDLSNYSESRVNVEDWAT